jgi:hypothetical protein
MRGSIASTLVLAGLLTPWWLFAQHRGAPHGFAPSSGGFRSFRSAPRTPVMPRQARSGTPGSSFRRFASPRTTGSSLINPGEASCLLTPSFAGSLYCRQYFAARPSWGYQPVYPGWFPTPGYEDDQNAPPAAEPEQDQQLAAQVNNLASEVEMMREEQAWRDSRRGPNTAVQLEEAPATVLVYRDGHQAEVQNYAILGKTLWVISSQGTHQVPLTELDLPATERANEERGVDFTAPDRQ